MSSILQITTFQIPLVWNAPKSNKSYIESKLQQIESTDLVILPETFTTGFAVENFEPETMEGDTVKWMIEMAKKFEIGIIGSLFIFEEGKLYNRMLLVTSDGRVQIYDKWHLFSLGNEGKLLTKGNKLPIFEYKNWKIKPLICYDLRFPVTARNLDNYDLIICIANWPKPRVEAWDTLLKARAIENLCYTVGVNRVGTDANGLAYIGHSNVYNPQGKILSEIYDKEKIAAFTLRKSEITKTRTSFPFLNDKDNFTINN